MNTSTNQLYKHSDCNTRPFQIGEIVYHRKVYEHREALKIVGILEDKLLLEGDFFRWYQQCNSKRLVANKRNIKNI